MRVLHYIDSTAAAVGGPSRFVIDACRMMADHGHTMTVATFDAADSPAEWLDADHARGLAKGQRGPAVCPLPNSNYPGGVMGTPPMRSLRKLLLNTDVVHLHGVFTPSNIQVAEACRKMGVPYVVSVHGMLDDWSMAQKSAKKRLFMSLVGKRYLEEAARVHCTAQAELDQSKKWFPSGAEAIVPYLFDLEPFRDLPGADLARDKFEFLRRNSGPTVLFLSRLHYKKGPEFLLRAAAKLGAWDIEGKVAFAGPGDAEYIRSLKDLARELRIEDNVSFLGCVTGRDKLSLYQSADLFVLPTSQENFGLVLIESLACGTPLITTKGVDIWRDVEASGAGAICDQRPEELAFAIADLLRDTAKRSAMSAKARPWVFDTFNEDRLCAEYEGMYGACAATA